MVKLLQKEGIIMLNDENLKTIIKEIIVNNDNFGGLAYYVKFRKK